MGIIIIFPSIWDQEGALAKTAEDSLMMACKNWIHIIPLNVAIVLISLPNGLKA